MRHPQQPPHSSHSRRGAPRQPATRQPVGSPQLILRSTAWGVQRPCLQRSTGAPGTGDRRAAEPGPYFWGRSPSLGVRHLCLAQASPAGCGTCTSGGLGREDAQVSWSLKGKEAKCDRCHHLVVPTDTSLARWV